MSMAEHNPGTLGFGSLLRVRFGIAAFQLVAVLAASLALELELPLAFLLCLIGLTAASNVWLARRTFNRGHVPASLIGGILAFDTIVLTALLYASGGAANPFSILYLVDVALAALMLGSRWTWSITALASSAYGLLFFVHLPLPWAHDHHSQNGFTGHLQGMWLAFACSSALIAYFVGRLSRAVRAKERELEQLRAQAERNERLASLTTLAAGAAHELSTPLSTVAVAAKEIERRVAALGDPTLRSLAEDARLIRAEMDRCRSILDQMGAQSGQSAGEAAEELSTQKLISELRSTMDDHRARRLRAEVLGGVELLHVPPKGLVRILASLLKNAFDASSDDAEVRFVVEPRGERASFSIIDRGSGMSAEVLARAIEPFFTTKDAGRGLGLGLFLVQSFADRLGGSFTIESVMGSGTKAILELPNVQRTQSDSSLRESALLLSTKAT